MGWPSSVLQGGVTAWGTLVAALGGQLISLCAYLTLVAENGACRQSGLTVGGSSPLLGLLVMGGPAGLIGSLVSCRRRSTADHYDQLTTTNALHCLVSVAGGLHPGINTATNFVLEKEEDGDP